MSDGIKNVLVTGGSGLLGRYLAKTAPRGVVARYTCHTRMIHEDFRNMDLCNQSSVGNAVCEAHPDIIIHTAAIGSVDYCDSHWQESYDVIVRGTRYLAGYAEEVGAKVIYISTNAVYDGENSPYAEDDERMPVNAYGSLKKDAEGIILRHPDWLVIRPIMLYGNPYRDGRGNWATRVIGALRDGMPSRIVYDTLTQPTYADDCAKAVWKLIDKEGSYNIAGEDRVSLFSFALKIAEVYGYDLKLIKGVKSSEFPEIARRPRDTTYDLTKLHYDGIYLDGIDAGLQRMKNELQHISRDIH